MKTHSKTLFSELSGEPSTKVLAIFVFKLWHIYWLEILILDSEKQLKRPKSLQLFGHAPKAVERYGTFHRTPIGLKFEFLQ